MTATQPMTLEEVLNSISLHLMDGDTARAQTLRAWYAAIESHIAAQAVVEKDAERWRKVVNHAYIGFNTHTKTTQWFLLNIHARTGQTFQQAIDIAIAKTGGEG
jgi:hypothetical protein